MKFKLYSIFLATILLALAAPLSAVSAQSQQQLRNEINHLDNKISQGENHLHELEQQAKTLEAHIGNLNSEIAKLESQINTTRGNIQETKNQIAAAEAELKRQQEIMDESIRVLYKQGNVSTVELIAASENFTDFINQQEYIERIKINVAEAAEKVKELKAELEDKNEKLSKLLAKQEGQKKIVESKRQEKRNALAYTKGQESRYQSYINRLTAQKVQAQKELEELIARLSRDFASQGPVKAGQPVGRIGNTGNSNGAHLHYEVRNGANHPVDPVFDRGSRELRWGFQWPHANRQVRVSRWYECHWYPTRAQANCPDGYWMHYGVDIAGGWGDIVYADADGEMQQVPNAGGAGNTVIIRHSNGLTSYYFHLSSFE